MEMENNRQVQVQLEVGEEKSSKICIQWEDIGKKLMLSSFTKYLASGLMTDIVLICDDNDCETSIRCHKLVLAATSKYFEQLIEYSENLQQSQNGGGGCDIIVVLKDVSRLDLLAVLKFIYSGQVILEEDKIPGFLKVAESLKINGIVSSPEQVVNNNSVIVEMESVDLDQTKSKNNTLALVEKNSSSQECCVPVLMLKDNNNKKTTQKRNKAPSNKSLDKNKNKEDAKPKVYKRYTKEQLTNALKDIGRGMSVAKAAKSHEIPLRTMYDQDRKRKLCVESCNKIEGLKKLKNKGSSSSSASNHTL